MEKQEGRRLGLGVKQTLAILRGEVASGTEKGAK